MSRRNKNKYIELQQSKPGYYGPESTPVPIKAPIKGWNTLDPLADMKPDYAPVMDNWVPHPGYVALRGGYNAWCQNLDGANSPIQSLMVYRPPGSIQRMFAASTTNIYEVTNNGVPTLSNSGLAGTARWQYINFTPPGGNSYIYLVNGTNAAIHFNGTTWTTPTITGVSSTLFVNITSFQRRIYFTEINSTRLWYLGVDSISGAATALELGPLMTEGGYVVGATNWTVDGGNGPKDLFVIITSEGQVIIYQGTDPTSSTDWTLVGVFINSKPIGRRALMKLGSDVLIITQDGVLPLSKSLPFNPAALRSVALTNKIQSTTSDASQMYKDNFGWELEAFSQQNLLILNVPVSENSQQQQYVMQQLTDGWCRFTGWNANCFSIFNDSLFFGDNTGNVNVAYTSNLDLTSPIVADMKCAFNFFGSPGKIKHMSMLKPYLVSDSTITPTLSIDADFSDASATANISIATPAGGTWDTSIWDQTNWSSGQSPYSPWLSVTGFGTALAVRMKVSYGGTSTTITAYGTFDFGVFDTAVFDGTGTNSASGLNLPVLQVVEFLGIIQGGGPI